MSDVIEQFKLIDTNGHTHEAVRLRPQVDRSTLEPTDEGFLRRIPKYRLSDGRALNRIDDYTFELVQTGEKLMRAN